MSFLSWFYSLTLIVFTPWLVSNYRCELIFFETQSRIFFAVCNETLSSYFYLVLLTHDSYLVEASNFNLWIHVSHPIVSTKTQQYNCRVCSESVFSLTRWKRSVVVSPYILGFICFFYCPSYPPTCESGFHKDLTGIDVYVQVVFKEEPLYFD